MVDTSKVMQGDLDGWWLDKARQGGKDWQSNLTLPM